MLHHRRRNGSAESIGRAALEGRLLRDKLGRNLRLKRRATSFRLSQQPASSPGTIATHTYERLDSYHHSHRSIQFISYYTSVRTCIHRIHAQQRFPVRSIEFDGRMNSFNPSTRQNRPVFHDFTETCHEKDVYGTSKEVLTVNYES